VPTLDRRRAFQVELDAPIATGTGCGSSQGGEVHPLDVVILLPYNALAISCTPIQARTLQSEPLPCTGAGTSNEPA
jgi:hypothetical protein